MATLFYYGSQHIILNSYVHLENQSVIENLNRTEANINNVVESIEAIAQDWAIWDDSYQFMQDNNQKFIKSSLAVSSFQSIKIDIMLFYDTSGKLKHAYAVNQDRSEFITPPKELLEALTPDNILVHAPDVDSSAMGLVSIPKGILFIASHAITTSENKGPPHGTLIVARYLTNPVLANIEHLIKADATIFRLPIANKDKILSHVYQKLINHNDNAIVKNNQTLSGYRFLFDIYKSPVAILRVDIPRSVYQIGLESLRYSNLVLFIYSLAITALLWVMLQYLIVKRIEKLSFNIGRQGKENRLLANLIENTSDEVSSVANLYHQATHDPLTGLANRNLLYQTFNHFANSNNPDRKIVILFIDLDHFKRINDTLGHDVGDEILVTTATRLSAALRGDDIAARLGGDEFVVMLVDIDKEQIESLTNRIFKSINHPIKYNDHEVYITCSMGVCVYPNDGDSIEKLIKEADVALYHAKETGRNHYQFYSKSLRDSINEAHQNEIDLQYALDDQQLCLYYQPIYDLKTKKIASLEALIRWNHPKRGLLTAGDIIPVAERTDLIFPISDWVLQTACKQLKTWLQAGVPVVPVAINASSLQLRQNQFSEKIINHVREVNLETRLLSIEITETGFFNITPKLISELETLRAAGIKLVIDDFGTGYAGLGYLKQLPVSKLKIDQSFTRDVQSNSGDRAITQAIITIAHQLNLQVVAEGIENIDQYNFMCHNQVNEGQGHFLCPPLSAEDCEKLLKESSVV